jgi:two-component sensor histidine kinase
MLHARSGDTRGGMMALPTSFDMTFAPTTRLVSVVRRFVLSLYERILEDGETSSQLALATHELLENAVKYNVDDETLLRVTLAPQSESLSAVAVTIRTRNRATPENIRTAQRIITTVRDAEDPFMFYQQLIQASSEAPEGSGLGLARIRAETAMTIDFKVDGDEIEIVAQAQLRFGGEP